MICEVRETDRAQAAAPFAAMDPGNNGCALVFRGLSRWEQPAFVLAANQPKVLAEAMRLVGASTLVVETQYVTNPQLARSVVHLAQGAGIVIGWIACEFKGGQRSAGRSLNLAYVVPSTWQATQAARDKRRGEKAMDRCMRLAEQDLSSWQWRSAHEMFRTGIAAAWGIAEWWRELWIV